MAALADSLDAAIQQRFTTVDGTFGFTRVMPRGTAHDFVPEVNWPARNTSDLHVGDVLGVVIYAYQESTS